MQTKNLLNQIAQIICDKKGFNITALKAPDDALCEYLIIADGFVGRHLQAIALYIAEELKKTGILPLKLEESENWAVMDYGRIMVHLFGPEARERYKLEQLWENAQEVQLKVDENLKETAELEYI